MEKLADKKGALQKDIKALKIDLRLAKQNKLLPKDGQKRVPTVEQLTKKLESSEKRLRKMELDMTVKDELKVSGDLPLAILGSCSSFCSCEKRTLTSFLGSC